MKEMASGAHYWNGEEMDVTHREARSRGNKEVRKKVRVRVATHLSRSPHEGCV